MPLQPRNRFRILVRWRIICPLDKSNRLECFIGQKELLLLSKGYAAEKRLLREGGRQHGLDLQRKIQGGMRT